MKKSLIRDYCQKVCKGDCCRDCAQKNKMQCWKPGKKRVLKCSTYLCGSLASFFSDNCKGRPWHIGHSPINTLRAVANHLGMAGLEFYQHDDEKRLVFYTIDEKLLKPLNDKNAEFIASLLSPFVKMGVDIKEIHYIKKFLRDKKKYDKCAKNIKLFAPFLSKN